ncbi:branched-chain amino acid ABC transporter permease [Amycolatopsis sp.]|uniref:branched-chain amino acid ABC transporter permease n=1 Tax=Amycolatopsis sp. TaxID=37632 RepID=UPI002C04FAE0|nr:branched-chain amino acid ABC transporter permease [Amycolatopsis sp.]HVV10472.1 branched-chain amino acid ABC transporter permease [Amycolatopsis sp.]
MNVIWAGLALGALYSLVALGYNIVFVSSNVFNFAHAQLLMLGTFLAFFGSVTLHLPPALVFPLAGVIVAAVAVLEERFAIRTVRGTEAQLVTTLGFATLLDGLTQVIWGGEPLQVPFFGRSEVITLFGGQVFPVELVLIGVVIVLTVLFVVISRNSMLGIAMLAVSEDREAALMRGINVRALAIGAFAVSGAVAGLLGPIVGPKTFAVATLGTALALKGFVAMAIGGFGSAPGALIGGLVVGLIEATTSRYLGESFATLMVFVALLVVLLVKPAGLFGHARERMV